MNNNYISKKLNSIFEPNLPLTIVRKQILYCKITYMSNLHSQQLYSEILNLVSKFFPQTNLRFILTNNRTIESLFKYQDEIPTKWKILLENIVENIVSLESIFYKMF